MADPRSARGLHGERLAERYLRRRKLKLVARRFHTPAGELDLVCLDGEVLVFVEVKSLSSRALQDPHERVSSQKQQRLCRAARAFLAQKRWSDRPCRFDVVSVLLSVSGEPQIEHFPDAFAPRW
ncbi:MAG: YraN family protein [Phycisphaerae bacterium]